MFFTLEKLERSTKKLKDLRYRERIEIPAFDASTPEEEPVENVRRASFTPEL